jgi:hypothetical protein
MPGLTLRRSWSPTPAAPRCARQSPTQGTKRGMAGAERLCCFWVRRWTGIRPASTRRTLTIGLLLMALMGYTGRCFATTAWPAQIYEHPNGLRLALSAEYRVTIIPDGFLIEPASGNDNRRYALQISINLLDRSPDIATDRLTRLGSRRRIRYAVTNLGGGGSGGDEYELVAIEYTSGRWIRYFQRAQSEWFEPSFEVWNIARNVRFTAR